MSKIECQHSHRLPKHRHVLVARSPTPTARSSSAIMISLPNDYVSCSSPEEERNSSRKRVKGSSSFTLSPSFTFLGRDDFTSILGGLGNSYLHSLSRCIGRFQRVPQEAAEDEKEKDGDGEQKPSGTSGSSCTFSNTTTVQQNPRTGNLFRYHQIATKRIRLCKKEEEENEGNRAARSISSSTFVFGVGDYLLLLYENFETQFRRILIEFQCVCLLEKVDDLVLVRASSSLCSPSRHGTATMTAAVQTDEAYPPQLSRTSKTSSNVLTTVAVNADHTSLNMIGETFDDEEEMDVLPCAMNNKKRPRTVHTISSSIGTGSSQPLLGSIGMRLDDFIDNFEQQGNCCGVAESNGGGGPMLPGSPSGSGGPLHFLPDHNTTAGVMVDENGETTTMLGGNLIARRKLMTSSSRRRKAIATETNNDGMPLESQVVVFNQHTFS